MSDFNYIPLGLNIPSQIPLDAKQYVYSEASLKNLGSSDQLAFTYVKGYIFYCIQEGTRFEWREVLSGSTEKGLMDNDYVYPDNVIVFGIDYSLKSYNFFRIDYENKKYFQSGSNTTLEGDGSEQNPFKYNAVQIKLSPGSNISFTGIGTEADPLVINADSFTQQNTDWNAVSGVTELLNKPSHFPPSAHTHSIADIDYLQSFLDKAELKENKGVPLGYVPLNIFGKIDEQYIERERNEYVNFKGYYNASLNIPELPLANTVKGHYYEILEDGIFQLIDYKKGDWIISDGNSWKRVSNQEYTDEKAQIAVVSRYIRFDVENKSPSEKAVFDALATKAPIVHTHTVSQITDFPTFKTIENQSIIGAGNIDLDKASVGLGNVDNTSDLSKPLSTATINALATKAPISSVHNPVTIGTANGLSLATQQLSLGLASSGVTGALSGTDWNTFNGKFNTPTGLTTNYLPKWNGIGFGNSSIFDNGTNIGIGTTTPTLSKLQTKGNDGSLIGYFYNNTGTPGQVYGVLIEAGTNTYDFALLVNSSQGSPYFKINGNGNSLFGTLQDNLVDRLQVSGTISASPATTANQVVVKSQLDAVAASSGTYTPSNQTNAAQTVNFIRSYWKKNGNVLTVTTSLTYTVTQTQSSSSFAITLPNGFLVSGVSMGRIIGSSLLQTTQGIFNNNANMKAYETADSSKINLQANFQVSVSSGTYETTIIYTVLIQ